MYKQIAKDFMVTYFSSPISKKQMRWNVEGSWLTVEYYENLTYSETTKPGNSKYSLLCAQDLKDYCIFKGDNLEIPVLIENELLNRILIMLFESLRSAKQDVNGMLRDNK